MNESKYFYKNIINTAYDKIITKIKKYYSKTIEKRNILYNLIVILNSTNKLNMYKLWNQKDDDDENNENVSYRYKKRYKEKFKNYFRRHYKNGISNFIIRTQRVNEVD